MINKTPVLPKKEMDRMTKWAVEGVISTLRPSFIIQLACDSRVMIHFQEFIAAKIAKALTALMEFAMRQFKLYPNPAQLAFEKYQTLVFIQNEDIKRWVADYKDLGQCQDSKSFATAIGQYPILPKDTDLDSRAIEETYRARVAYHEDVRKTFVARLNSSESNEVNRLALIPFSRGK